MKITALTMSRGDEHRLTEWIRYHAALGIDAFYVILDAPIDNSHQKLMDLAAEFNITVDVREPYEAYYDGMSPSERYAKVLEWREEHRDRLTSAGIPVHDSLAERQFLYFTDVLNALEQDENHWIAIFDLDEFIVLGQGEELSEVLDNSGGDRVRFLNFNVDTSNHDPSQPFVTQHTKRWDRGDLLAYGKGWATRVKTITRSTKTLPFVSIHTISSGAFVTLPIDQGRLLHYRIPDQGIQELPYTVEDLLASEFYSKVVAPEDEKNSVRPTKLSQRIKRFLKRR